jgi:hypothetical protein
MVFPLDDTNCMIQKAWFLETEFIKTMEQQQHMLQDLIQTSLSESIVVHEEDVFLCENAQPWCKQYGI